MANFLQLNLEIISSYNQRLADKIMQVNNYKSDFSFLYTENKEVVLVKDFMVMNDTLAPLDEALKLSQNTPNNNEHGTCVIIGFELGYMLSAFANNFQGTIIILEPCIETLRLGLDMIDYSKSLARSGVYIVSDLNELNDIIVQTNKRNYSRYKVVANKFYSANYKDLIVSLTNQLEELHSDPYTGGDMKLNIGAGHWASKEWRTLDCYKDADFYVDLREMDKLDIEDNCIEKAFSSHCIEHIKDEHIETMFKELYRCMKPGGIFRVSCPDADIALNEYKKNNKKWFSWLKDSHLGEMLLNTFVSYEYMAGGPKVSEEEVKEKFETLSKEEFLNWAVSLVDETRPYIAHRNALYFSKVKKMLENAGFKNVKKSSFLNSSDKEFQSEVFDKHQNISLYVECYK